MGPRIGQTRMTVRVWAGVVVGPVQFEPGMTRVRPESGPVRRVLTEYLTLERQRECTAAEGKLWRERYTAGYSHGRADARWNQVRQAVVVVVPAELPFETGAQYVARHLDLAYRIGYTAAAKAALRRESLTW